MHHSHFRWLVTGLLVATCAVAGCGLRSGATPNLEWLFGTNDGQTAEIEHRERYNTDRDPDAMNWLLVNRVRQGMTKKEVDTIFGEDGSRINQDLKYKTGGNYRATDVGYRWGPDSDARSVYLFFRGGQLTDFDPAEFDK